MHSRCSHPAGPVARRTLRPPWHRGLTVGSWTTRLAATAALASQASGLAGCRSTRPRCSTAITRNGSTRSVPPGGTCLARDEYRCRRPVQDPARILVTGLVARLDVVHGLVGRKTGHRRQTGERSVRPAPPTAADDLVPGLPAGARPELAAPLASGWEERTQAIGLMRSASQSAVPAGLGAPRPSPVPSRDCPGGGLCLGPARRQAAPRVGRGR